MKIQFYLTNHENKMKERPIRASISIKGTRLQKPIGFSVSPGAWDQDTDTVASGYTNSKGIEARIINRRIVNLKSHFADYDLDLYDKPTEKDLRVQFELAINKRDTRDVAQAKAEQNVEKRKRGRPRKEQTDATDTDQQPKGKKALEAYIDEFIKECTVTNSWEESTVRMVKVFKNHIVKFKKAKDFDYFNRDGINNFIIYLRDTGGLQENSVKKQFKNLLWFMNWAIRKGYTTETTVQTYKPKFKLVDKPVIFLTKDELMTLYKYQIPANGTEVELKDQAGKPYIKIVQEAGALEKTRDLFCFCAFTSLRYSDMAELRRSNIDGKIMHITTQKTHDSLDIDLNPMARAILDKYKKADLPDGHALPVISNQKMNSYLKNLCELCGINSPVTETCIRGGKRETVVYPKYAKVGTHAGRRSFICFALSSGIPPQVVMKWTGHSDYKSMKPYIDIATKTKSDAMKKITASWEKK